ncbi:uncharacterized protein SPAPADRAFT_50181 [Spathaspora passalidarum NRRL Y-27907]|uniref:RING-type domain-containing protein n=1 Tax=Spathaspora passalidarum (strain NRRL Y-27907 / 11-Y1) TaxID=619300 RepID=G3ALN9_SPAPN|nr:uncharacterized protein SPAPADRAFT_50181 [Spathaspora passalidarum NRRL Y-27907]EGW33283.1 hypothetical protein SPAPADRAFT_50181 [Spathaspora passalidarum NRRL Y-27907]
MDPTNNIPNISVPSRPRKHSLPPHESTSSNPPRHNSIVEIVSDEEPEIIDLDNEPEPDSSFNNEVEIVSVNTENPTPITENISSVNSLFVPEETGDADLQDDVEITNVRRIGNNHHNHHTVHTPFGQFRVFMPDRRPVQQHEPIVVHPPQRATLRRLAHQPLESSRRAAQQRMQQSRLARDSRRHIQARPPGPPLISRILNFGRPFHILPFRNHPDPEEIAYFQNMMDAMEGIGSGGFESNAVEESILRRIERDNERDLNERLQRETSYNNKALQEKKKLAANHNEQTRHVTTIKSDENLVCELCGIVLGEGIPEDFAADPAYNEHFDKYTGQYQVQAPWFCIYPMTQVDKELSKRIFVAKCGHTFCGRCVKNIGNRPRRTKATRSGLTILNPSIFAPSKCPETKCMKKFTAKGFTEVYF